MNEEFTARKAPVEQLTMPTTDLNPSPVAPQTEDWGMTNPLGTLPDGRQNDGWKMPEPVFRVSDGFCPLKSDGKSKNAAAVGDLPQSFAAPPQQPLPTDESLAHLYAPPEKEDDADLSQHTMHNLSLSDLQTEIPELTPVTPKVAAAPQPNISQEFVVKPTPKAPTEEKKQRSETMRLVFAAAGILAMLAFAAGFLTLIYYLFFYKAAA